VHQQEREPGVAGGRSRPHVKANLISEKRNGDGQSECHVPEIAVGSKDTCTQGSTESTNRNAEIKLEGDQGGVTDRRDHSTHTRVNPSLRNGSTVSLPGGDEPRIGPGSSNKTQTQVSQHRENPNVEGQPEDGGLGIEVGGYKEVGTRESSHSINRHGDSQPGGDGGGMAISRTVEDNSAINGNTVSQPEDGEMRMAVGNYNNTHPQTSSSPADRNSGGHLEGARLRIAGSSSRAAGTWDGARSPRSSSPVGENPKGRLGGGGRGLGGSGNRAVHRWENPDSAGGLAHGTGRGRLPVQCSLRQPRETKTLSSRLTARVKRSLRFFHLACMTPPE